MRRRGIAPVVLVVAFLLGGCETLVTDTGPACRPGVSSRASAEQRDQRPPAVAVSHGGTTLTIDAWDTRFGDYCVRDAPPDDLPDLGVVDGPIGVDFPVAGWEFRAVQNGSEVPQAKRYCETFTLPATFPSGAGTEFELAGAADTYVVDLKGRGPEGKLNVSFTATSAADNDWPEPRARATGFLEDAEHPAMLFFELTARYVGADTDGADGHVVLIGPDGEHTLPFVLPECQPRATINLGTYRKAGPIFAEVGEPPYDVRFELDLDGVRHEATVRWSPADKPARPKLSFDPPLPRY